eukprot:4573056-Alexandrium_andersonii.AAC.1
MALYGAALSPIPTLLARRLSSLVKEATTAGVPCIANPLLSAFWWGRQSPDLHLRALIMRWKLIRQLWSHDEQSRDLIRDVLVRCIAKQYPGVASHQDSVTLTSKE